MKEFRHLLPDFVPSSCALATRNTREAGVSSAFNLSIRSNELLCTLLYRRHQYTFFVQHFRDHGNRNVFPIACFHPFEGIRVEVDTSDFCSY